MVLKRRRTRSRTSSATIGRNVGRSAIRRAKYLALAMMTLPLSACSPGGPSGIAIEGVTVIDPVDGVSAEQRVIVRDGVIVAVAPMDAPAEEVAERVDASAQFLIPGLWDMHVHFLYDQAMKPH
ncbi:MAG: hypothetical protein AAGE43_14465, partial [Pseudomonadota bacterium]